VHLNTDAVIVTHFSLCEVEISRNARDAFEPAYRACLVSIQLFEWAELHWSEVHGVLVSPLVQEIYPFVNRGFPFA
jgi:hypothetical protein